MLEQVSFEWLGLSNEETEDKKLEFRKIAKIKVFLEFFLPCITNIRFLTTDYSGKLNAICNP